jgi:hypothetical protein
MQSPGTNPGHITRILTDIHFWVPLIVLVAGLFLLGSLE